MRKVAVIVGSIRKDSINKKLAGAIERLGAEKLAFDRVRIDDLPLFNQDRESEPIPEVLRVREQITAADAVLFVTPEHNRSIPAALKNVIDWATRPSGQSKFRGKVCAITGTSRGSIRTAVAQSHLRTILIGHVSALLGWPEAFIQFKDGLVADDGNVTDDGTRKVLQNFVEAFAKLVEGMAGK